MALILLALLGLSAASAQLTYPPEELANVLGGKLKGNTLRFHSSLFGSAVLNLEVRGGLVTRVTYAGKPDDINAAARGIAYASGYFDTVNDLVKWMSLNRQVLHGRGPQQVDFADDVNLTVDWGDRLRFALEMRKYTFDDAYDRHVLGRSGPIIREFSDFECPYCAQLYREVMPTIKRAVQQGQARFSYLQVPLTRIHPQAMPLALGSECAAQQGKFYPFHDLAFETDARVAPIELARRLKLDAPKFTKCLKDPAVRKRVDADNALAERVGVRGTPTTFVGPYRVYDPHNPEAYLHLIRFIHATK
ncbi:hypothetical protein HNR42_000590 [Deinobacterium chartae]|uniref:Thioredoxin domain-containing protein n=1 Tax=Deinobacterium chartae TaxID=521158 RepID=A0A841HW84_9DEIO|nr:thioredoxin domain-containing protein [Deinobacterium chartae]MBB6097176.1 hypothetical protein [Deinobacterium chartae]